MNTAEILEIWAPEASPWSVWAKPALFADDLAPQRPLDQPPSWRELDAGWAPTAGGQTTIILDLPGAWSVLWGLALAARGYRPVPLFNCTSGIDPVVNVGPLRGALFAFAPDLQAMPIPPEAPPVFLLDSQRFGKVSVSPGRFDNRWVVFPEDFPSANFLRSRGVGCALLAQRTLQIPARDLAHVLLRWQQSHLALATYDVLDGGPLQPLTVSRPSYFRILWYRALVVAGLRRHSGGGFGALVPDAGHSGYG